MSAGPASAASAGARSGSGSGSGSGWGSGSAARTPPRRSPTRGPGNEGCARRLPPQGLPDKGGPAPALEPRAFLSLAVPLSPSRSRLLPSPLPPSPPPPLLSLHPRYRFYRNKQRSGQGFSTMSNSLRGQPICELTIGCQPSTTHGKHGKHMIS
ncbi:wiskott-Aldrich syndrome protein homolog [Canis lupus dingo]|uniref:wiskott-Aldrich syndrome protein homolog n=1 Tax=Canis lupus dingo TaxID=286419 RepID=UPI0020C3A37B|nr:wiskott-Aldrich syndrome protein homolog [Canis lupus dingo]